MKFVIAVGSFVAALFVGLLLFSPPQRPFTLRETLPEPRFYAGYSTPRKTIITIFDRYADGRLGDCCGASYLTSDVTGSAGSETAKEAAKTLKIHSERRVRDGVELEYSFTQRGELIEKTAVLELNDRTDRYEVRNAW